MLIVNKTYHIIFDDKNDTFITIEKDGEKYHWNIKNDDGDELGFVLTKLNMADVFQAIKEMTNLV